MPQFELINVDSAQGRAKDLLDLIQKKMGLVPNVYAVMAQAPSTLAGQLAQPGC